MRKYLFLNVLFIFSCLYTYAQMPHGAGRSPGAMAGPSQNIGKVFGRAVDSTNKGIDAATVHVFRIVTDSATRAKRQMLHTSAITKANGDFFFENLPTGQRLMVQISAVGYDTYDSQEIMILPMNADVNLATIRMTRNVANLQDVVVTSNARQFMEMGVDRKIFNVQDNVITAGQTAQEVMKQIPSLNVDIDGNVTVRNAAPQVFVDGRPTTLTLEQIPADIIDKVELITNPGAKFDASGGGAGILNIVLKKNKRIGYNGGLMVGADTRGSYNLGGDINLRQGKFNVFARGMYRKRSGLSRNELERNNLNDTSLVQKGESDNGGEFKFFNLGTDYFIDNRNTITLSGNYVNGVFNNSNSRFIDSLYRKNPYAYNLVESNSNHEFTNVGAQFSFRHNFDSASHFISFDANYNEATSTNSSDINTGMYSDADRKILRRPQVLQYNNGKGYNKFSTFQVDYENPLSANAKIEGGVRANFSSFGNDNLQYVDSTGTGGNSYIFQPLISSRYKFNDQVYAAYATFSSKIGDKFKYQLGLRAESSKYNAENKAYTRNGKDTLTTFQIDYPISLFPSAYLTYTITPTQDLQLNYSRRIRRPNFFQLLPTPDLSDPYNVQVGNPGLKPEFTDSYELSYNKTYKNRGNFLATAYLRKGNDLIINYQYMDTTISASPVTSYLNASNSLTYGLELTNKFNPARFWELTVNLNFYNARINSKLNSSSISSERFSWFGKINNNFKLPKNFTVQLSADYQAKSVIPVSGGGGRGFMGGGNAGTAQGYILPRFDTDLAIRKDFKFKNNNTLTASLSVSDLFGTARFRSYTETPFMTQTSTRYRQPQVARLNLSYRFGRMDTSIFKRRSKGISGDDRGSISSED